MLRQAVSGKRDLQAPVDYYSGFVLTRCGRRNLRMLDEHLHA